MQLAVFDFDDTVSVQRRDRLVPRSDPISPRLELLKHHLEQYPRVVVYVVTGRATNEQSDVYHWLRDHGAELDPSRILTAVSQRSKKVCKLEHFRGLLALYHPERVFVYDDDPSIREVYAQAAREAGVPAAISEGRRAAELVEYAVRAGIRRALALVE